MIRVLVVDDSFERVKIINDAIISSKYAANIEVVYSDTADKARRELKEFFDLLVLDILLPKKVGGIPQAANSASLLSDVCMLEGRYIRPGLIIGLTADVNELDMYKAEFLRSASVVLAGTLHSRDWVVSLLNQLESLIGAKRKVVKKSSKRLLLTIHGIRTYGQWQSALQQETKEYSAEFDYVDVKYGYFDILSFCIPYFRSTKIAAIAARIEQIVDAAEGKDIYIVSHSFGTMIACGYFKVRKSRAKIKRLIMCGSPLNHKYDLDDVVSQTDMTVNDCGTKDLILVLARMFVLGLGDAGRCGFQREHTSTFVNRFHQGGHSLYFADSDYLTFAERYWLPLLISEASPVYSDDRKNFAGEDFFELGIKIMGAIKPWIYGFGVIIAILLFMD